MKTRQVPGQEWTFICCGATGILPTEYRTGNVFAVWREHTGRRNNGIWDCGECNRKRSRGLDKKKRAEYVKRTNTKLRLEAFRHYCGNAVPFCQCNGCKVNAIEFLQLDHIDATNESLRPRSNYVQYDGGRTKGRRRLLGGITFYRWLKNNGYPEGFQVLCVNCNFAKRTKTQCPLYGKSHCTCCATNEQN